jgi:membrane-associated PAP2 superfamily phosphatase
MSPAQRPGAPARFFLFWSLGGLLLLLAWDYSGLDRAMAHWFGTSNGFPLEHHWLWRGVLHEDIHFLPWLLELGLLVAVARPFGAFRQLPGLRRAQLALTTLVALLLVANIKRHSLSSCPWDLQEFGGMATYVSHWTWGLRDGGGGGCFPAGHASGGFAFLGGFFVFRRGLPRTARRWLAGALLAGLVMGMAQQVRGAHYMSHTLWTAWLCWATAGLVDLGVSQWIARKRLFAPTLAPATAAPTPWLQPASRD